MILSFYCFSEHNQVTLVALVYGSVSTSLIAQNKPIKVVFEHNEEMIRTRLD